MGAENMRLRKVVRPSVIGEQRCGYFLSMVILLFVVGFVCGAFVLFALCFARLLVVFAFWDAFAIWLALPLWLYEIFMHDFNLSQ